MQLICEKGKCTELNKGELEKMLSLQVGISYTGVSTWPRVAEDAGTRLLLCLKDYPRLRAASWFRSTKEISVLSVSPEQTCNHWVIYSRIQHLIPFHQEGTLLIHFVLHGSL